MAKSVVSSGLSARCLVQLSYAIGVAKPLSLFVETYGSEKTGLTVNDITSILKHLGGSFRTAVGVHGGQRKTACQGVFMFISLTVASVS